MIYLHKILPVFFSPIFIVLALALLAYFLRKRLLATISISILLAASNPLVGNWAMRELEKGYAPQTAQNAETAEYIVVLGGMLRPLESPDGQIHYEFNEAGDRFLAGVQLFDALKAPKIVFTRGKLPWQKGLSEGDVLSIWAQELGVPKGDILLTKEVENTQQEALAVDEILPDNAKILLVTSAFHMPRARDLFEAQNLTVIPHAVDFRQSATRLTFMDLLPSAGALAQSSLFVREMIAKLYYWVRG